MAARFVSTSRLGNIIQMIAISRQTGILRVTRNQGGLREMGQIRFMQGEPASALLGSLTGGNALTAMSVWGECMYAFDENDTEFDMTGMAGFEPSAQAGPGPQTPTGPGSSWPSYGYPSTSSLNSYSPPPPDSSMPGSNDPLGVYPGDQSSPLSLLYGNYAPPEAARPSQSSYAGPATTTAYSFRPDQLASRPRRTTPSMNVDQLPLDRRERMVLLLVDGQRTVLDLVRLTRRNEGDLYAVLNHLRILGLVAL